MKKRNFIWGLLLLGMVISIPLFTSCDDDDDDVYWIGLATVKEAQDGSYFLVLDDKETLKPNKNLNYESDKEQRAIIEFNVTGEDVDGYDYAANIYTFIPILTKNPIELTEENKESIGNDPINIRKSWIGDDYLNFSFEYLANGEYAHFINLVKNTTVEHPNDGKVYLEFRHNQENDHQNYWARGYVSFDLSGYTKATTFVIKNTNMANKVETFEISYDPTKDYPRTTVEKNIEEGKSTAK